MPSITTKIVSFLHFVLSLLPSSISSRIYSLIFCLNLGFSISPPPAPVKTTTTLLTYPTNVFTHPSNSPTKPHPSSRTILVIHSIAASAHNDPRILTLAQSFVIAHPRNIVLIPYLPPLANADISSNPAQLIRQVIEAVAKHPELCPTARLSVVSSCISAGFTLVATTSADYVDAALLIGSHADVRNSLQHALKSQGKDDARYGINCVLSSFWDATNKPLKQMLAAYCEDDHLRNINVESNALQPLLQQYPEEANTFHRLHDDVEFLSQSLKDIYQNNEQAFINLSPMHYLNNVKCRRVVLLHAKNDEIVPPSESNVLKTELDKMEGVETSCLITSLLNHGDQEAIGVKHVPEIFRMIDLFSNFFRPIPNQSRTEDSAKKTT